MNLLGYEVTLKEQDLFMLVCERYKFVLSTESSALESIEIVGQPKVTVGLQFGFYFDRLSFLVLTHMRIWTWVCQFFCGHEPNKHIVWKHLALDFSIFHAPGTNIFTQFRIESWLSRVEFSSHFFSRRGCWLLYSGCQKARRPHWGGEDCSSRKTLPWK